ncbi:MAG: serine/threonine protein phosphatase [Ruminococcaceae bacterium]|nr:serine/threonine protein phosphatase [Oscillospiraceae bacterium]
MALFVMADLHLSLDGEKPMDIFGSRWQDHQEKIKSRWLSLVSAEDTVMIPGDISWSMTLEGALPDLLFINSLPGRKIISKGNHEYWWSTAAKINKLFNANGIDTIELLHNNALEAEGFAICGTRGWFTEANAPKDADYDKIVTREAGRLQRSLEIAQEENPEKEKLVFLHFPPALEGFVCREIIDVMHAFNVKRCFFGHIHGKYNIPRSYDFEGIEMRLISSDFLDFYPYPIQKNQ